MANLVSFDWAIKRLLRNKADYCIVEGLLTVFAIFICAVTYLFTLFFFRAVTVEDIKMLPKGERILAFLLQYKLIKE